MTYIGDISLTNNWANSSQAKVIVVIAVPVGFMCIPESPMTIDFMFTTDR